MGVREITGQRWLRQMLLALLVAYVLLFTICYTLEFRVELGSVLWLTESRVALLCVAGLYLMLARPHFMQVFDPFALCILAAIITGLISGLLTSSSWFIYFRQLFQYSFLLVFYLVGRELSSHKISTRSMNWVSIAILVGYAVASAIFLATPGLHSGSYSFQPNLALLPVAWALALGNWLFVLLGTVLVVLGNKRAVYVGLSLMIAIYIAIRVQRNRKATMLERIALVGLFAPMIGVLLGGAVYLFTWSLDSVAKVSVPTVVERFTVAPTFNGGADAESRPEGEIKVDSLVRLTSARSVEFLAVWEIVTSSAQKVLLGQGFGSSFTVKYFSPNDYAPVQFERIQADLAPVQIALTSGIPLACAFVILLLGMTFSIFLKVDTLSRLDTAIALFSIGLLLDTLLGFHPTNPLCWLALGIASGRMLPNISLASLIGPKRKGCS